MRVRLIMSTAFVVAGVVEFAFANGSSPRMAVFSRSYEVNHYSSTWTGSGWGTAIQYNTGPDESIWMSAANCPKRNEIAIATLDYGSDVRAYFRTSSGFSAQTVCTTNTGGYTQRRFDLAYEDLSGDLLVTYWDNAAARIGYRTASGTTLSAQSNYDIGSTSARFIALAPQKNSNNIALLTVNASGGLVGGLWTGSSWYGIGTIASSVSNPNNESFGVAFEGTSGDAMVVYGVSGSNTPRYRTFVGGLLSSEQTLASMSGTPRWVRMISRPGTNTILCLILSDSNQLAAYQWNGTSWVGNTTISSSIGGSTDRRFDVAFDPSGATALLAYSTGSSTLRYQTWNGSSWSGQVSGPTFPNVVRIVRLSTGSTGSQILGLCTDDNWQLNAFHWTGSAITSGGTINTPLGGEANCEAFTLVPPGGSAVPAIKSWTQVEP